MGRGLWVSLSSNKSNALVLQSCLAITTIAVSLSAVTIILDWSVLGSLMMTLASWMVMLGLGVCSVMKFAGICSQFSCHLWGDVD